MAHYFIFKYELDLYLVYTNINRLPIFKLIKKHILYLYFARYATAKIWKKNIILIVNKNNIKIFNIRYYTYLMGYHNPLPGKTGTSYSYEFNRRVVVYLQLSKLLPSKLIIFHYYKRQTNT